MIPVSLLSNPGHIGLCRQCKYSVPLRNGRTIQHLVSTNTAVCAGSGRTPLPLEQPLPAVLSQPMVTPAAEVQTLDLPALRRWAYEKTSTGLIKNRIREAEMLVQFILNGAVQEEGK